MNIFLRFIDLLLEIVPPRIELFLDLLLLGNTSGCLLLLAFLLVNKIADICNL
jgi:hypothetical protein